MQLKKKTVPMWRKTIKWIMYVFQIFPIEIRITLGKFNNSNNNKPKE